MPSPYRYRGDGLETHVAIGETHRGEISGWDDSDPTDIKLKLATTLPNTDDLVVRYFCTANSERSDANLRIDKVHDPRPLGIADQSLVERFVDPLDYAKGIIYTIARSPASPKSVNGYLPDLLAWGIDAPNLFDAFDRELIAEELLTALVQPMWPQ